MKLRKGSIIFAGLLSLGLMMTPICAHAENDKTADDYFKTTMTSQEGMVTVSLELEENSGFTSAQTVIYYDPEIMRVYSVETAKSLDLADVNTTYKLGDKVGVSLAWASEKEMKKEADLMKVVFAVNHPSDGQKIATDIDVLQAYNADGAMALEEGVRVAATRLSIQTANTTSSSSASTTPAQTTTPAKKVVTGKGKWTGIGSVSGVLAETETTALFSIDNEHSILKADLLRKYSGKNMLISLGVSSEVALSIDAKGINFNIGDVDFASVSGEVKDFAADFDTFRFQPMVAQKLSYEIGLHLHVGKEKVGKTAYIFRKSLLTGEYVLDKVCVVNEIGNVGLFTDEYTEVMVLTTK